MNPLPTQEQQQALRRLPAVHRLLEHPIVKPYHDRIPHSYLSQCTADVLAMRRREILEHSLPGEVSETDLADRVVQNLRRWAEPRLKPSVNATGIILHTNLGRAVLSEEAADAISRIARSASNLEYRLEEGERGSRQDHVEELLQRLTGAEAAMVVNNNAAAVFLVLRALAEGKKVIVSRGQLVEIGGSFRVSEIMRESGARLVEVGTTNKTRERDVAEAITEETGLLLKVHTSNFKIIGFTEEVPRKAMVHLADQNGIPFFEDLGSGVLYDLKKHGIGDEPTVQECVRAGVDLLSFSGDKLLGGPQAGIIVGRKEWIQRLKRHQLARSLRVDKFTLAGLESTLRHYLNPEEAAQKIPTLHQILKPAEKLQKQAEQLKQLLSPEIGDFAHLEVIPSQSEVGGGSLPGVEMPTYCLAVTPVKGSVTGWEKKLRQAETPVIGRVSKDKLFFDLRTMEEADFPRVVQTFREVIATGEA
ncbi:L-seryl-tRNA(Sec) selenium transferase [Paludifilum halophilum]|uniref:L-seryl-tRNA(Sec) selenium transferase n=1 Tax=Paludifilum halophilum TaxID=1642702 RepID=A0A235B807_9BACL|nr:L-seryl-tRNA(Sec) selenium transferase [Paludifilum halophilum]OYD07725.1 L-seryl-tRNA(Sec) selenium transferase [Paludifilum halophilum]